MNLLSFTCEHCLERFTLDTQQAAKNRGRFCTRECANAFKVGKPTPGFITPTSLKAERVRANGLVAKRLKLGWFEKPTACMKCGAVKRLDSHHADYAKPAEVYWLCRSCHVTAHHDPNLLDGIAPFICDDRRLAPLQNFNSLAMERGAA